MMEKEERREFFWVLASLDYQKYGKISIERIDKKIDEIEAKIAETTGRTRQ